MRQIDAVNGLQWKLVHETWLTGREGLDPKFPAPKSEASLQETPKSEASAQEAPQPETPIQIILESEVTVLEAPKTEALLQEITKYEAPKV